MDTTFIKSENSEVSNPHVLMLKLTNKLDLRIGGKIIAPYQTLVFITRGKT